MKRFSFRLQRVQALRQQEAGAARLVLAQAIAALARCEERVAVIDQLATECQTLESTAVRPLASGLLRGIEAARVRAQRARAGASQQLMTARENYQQRRAAASAIEKLYDAKRAAWRASMEAAEHGELEEVARLARQAGAAQSADGAGEERWTADRDDQATMGRETTESPR